MKKIYSNILVSMALAVLVSCGDSKKDEPTPDPAPGDSGVELSISTAKIDTKAAVLEYGSGSTMNVFPKTYNSPDAPNITEGVKGSFDGMKWTLSPAVYIPENMKNTYVYAVSPYDASYTDVEKIPVDLDKQVDLMYSGAAVPASRNTPVVNLVMNHALSLLSFNIVGVNYSGAGKLTSLSINGANVYRTATMDASRGKITLGEIGEVKGSFDRKVETGGWATDIPGLWTLPFNTKQGAVTLTAVIDGKTYEAVLPEVEVKQGWQYIFRLALTNSGLEFDPSKTETLSLNVITDEKQEFAGYGKIVITASGSQVHAPVVEGSAVFGTLASPSEHVSYTENRTFSGLNSGDNVTVEVWNSDGFNFTTLEGVGAIDISGYE